MTFQKKAFYIVAFITMLNGSNQLHSMDSVFSQVANKLLVHTPLIAGFTAGTVLPFIADSTPKTAVASVGLAAAGLLSTQLWYETKNPRLDNTQKFANILALSSMVIIPGLGAAVKHRAALMKGLIDFPNSSYFKPTVAATGGCLALIGIGILAAKNKSTVTAILNHKNFLSISTNVLSAVFSLAVPAIALFSKDSFNAANYSMISLATLPMAYTYGLFGKPRWIGAHSALAISWAALTAAGFYKAYTLNK